MTGRALGKVRLCYNVVTCKRRGTPSDAHQEARDRRLQVLRGPHGDPLRSRRHRHRRPERLRQVEHRRRHPLVPGRAERQAPPRPRDGGRDLQRLRVSRAAWPRRGDDHLRQHQSRLRRFAADRVPRLPGDRGHAPALSRRHQRVPDQQDPGPPAGRDRAVPRHRRRHQGLLDRRAGPHRADRQRARRRSPHVHRRGRRHHQVQASAASRRSARWS